MTPREARNIAKAIAERVGRDVYVHTVKDDYGAYSFLAWDGSSLVNSTNLIGNAEHVREDRDGFYLTTTGERIK